MGDHSDGDPMVVDCCPVCGGRCGLDILEGHVHCDTGGVGACPETCWECCCGCCVMALGNCAATSVLVDWYGLAGHATRDAVLLGERAQTSVECNCRRGNLVVVYDLATRFCVYW